MARNRAGAGETDAKDDDGELSGTRFLEEEEVVVVDAGGSIGATEPASFAAARMARNRAGAGETDAKDDDGEQEESDEEAQDPKLEVFGSCASSSDSSCSPSSSFASVSPAPARFLAMDGGFELTATRSRRTPC
jgi:hypothetical protein